MLDIEPLLTRWQSAGALDAEAAAHIRALECKDSEHSGAAAPGGAGWLGVTALFCAAILIACGVVLFVSAHWDQFSPGARFVLVLAMVAVFHIAGGMARTNFRGLSIALHAVGTISTGAAIMLVGEIFNLEYHWPNVVLLWALAALAGWMLLRDQAQQTLALLLVPAWIFSSSASAPTATSATASTWAGCVSSGQFSTSRSFLARGARRCRGILFAAGAIAAVAGIFEMLSSWVSFSAEPELYSLRHARLGLDRHCRSAADRGRVPRPQGADTDCRAPLGLRSRCHGAIPRGLKLTPTAAGAMMAHVGTSPNLRCPRAGGSLCRVSLLWGARMASHALVNLGIVGFAAAVVWFYFSDIYSDKNRAIGLIGLGVLFLAGGWALENARRRILKGMRAGKPAAPQAAAGQDTTQGTEGGAR